MSKDQIVLESFSPLRRIVNKVLVLVGIPIGLAGIGYGFFLAYQQGSIFEIFADTSGILVILVPLMVVLLLGLFRTSGKIIIDPREKILIYRTPLNHLYEVSLYDIEQVFELRQFKVALLHFSDNSIIYIGFSSDKLRQMFIDELKKLLTLKPLKFRSGAGVNFGPNPENEIRFELQKAWTTKENDIPHLELGEEESLLHNKYSFVDGK